MNENKTAKKKRTLTKTVLIVALIMIFLFRYRDYIFNMISIKKHSLDTYDESYDTYTEYKIDENGEISTSLEIIEFEEVRFNHVYGELEENNYHSERSFSKKNEDDIVIIIYPEDLERVDIAEYYEIPHHIRSYMVDAYGEDLFSDNYTLLKKAFEITPDDLSFFGKSRNKLVSNTVLFILKSLEMPNIFEYKRVFFESKNIKGFQDGLAGENSAVYLNIFDATGKVDTSYYIMIIGNTRQEEIDLIINSTEFDAKK